MTFEPAPEFQSYEEVPTLRKRWVFVLSVLFFIPLGLGLALTGDIYAFQKGRVVKMNRKNNIALTVCWSAIIAMRLALAFLTENK